MQVIILLLTSSPLAAAKVASRLVPASVRVEVDVTSAFQQPVVGDDPGTVRVHDVHELGRGWVDAVQDISLAEAGAGRVQTCNGDSHRDNVHHQWPGVQRIHERPRQHITGKTLQTHKNYSYWQLMILISMHLIPIEGVDWPKLHNMFKTREATTSQRHLPNSACAFHLLSTSIYSRSCCSYTGVVKAKHALLTL